MYRGMDVIMMIITILVAAKIGADHSIAQCNSEI